MDSEQTNNIIQEISKYKTYDSDEEDPYSKPLLVRQCRYNNLFHTTEETSIEEIFSTSSVMRSISISEKSNADN